MALPMSLVGEAKGGLIEVKYSSLWCDYLYYNSTLADLPVVSA